MHIDDDLTVSILKKVSKLTGSVRFDESDFPGYSNNEIQERLRALKRAGRIRGTLTAGSDDVTVLGSN